jgi:hypothetical protein
MQELPFGERSAKHILFHIFKQIVNYKKQDNTKGEVRHGIYNRVLNSAILVWCGMVWCTV